MRLRLGAWMPFVLFLVLALFLWRGLSLDPNRLPSTQLGKELPTFALKTLQPPNKTFSSADMKGHIALLNVWASWCSTCAKEQLFLLTLSQQGVPIYGLNYKDNERDAVSWLDTWGNPYVKIGQDNKGLVSMDLGVYGTPETFLIDKQGRIRYRHTGILTAQIWQTVFVPKIALLEQEASS